MDANLVCIPQGQLPISGSDNKHHRPYSYQFPFLLVGMPRNRPFQPLGPPRSRARPFSQHIHPFSRPWPIVLLLFHCFPRHVHHPHVLYGLHLLFFPIHRISSSLTSRTTGCLASLVNRSRSAAGSSYSRRGPSCSTVQ